VRFFAGRKSIARVIESPQPGRASSRHRCPVDFHRPLRVMHRDVSRGDVPLPACLGVRDLVASNSQRRSRLLIFLGGANVFAATLFCNHEKHLHRADVSARPRTNIPFARRRRRSFGPPSGRVRDRLFGRRHSWVFNPFAGLLPIASGAMFPSAGPACRLPIRSPRLIFVAGSVVLKGKLDLKKTNDHELVVAASRLHSRVRSAPRGFLSARTRSCLGLCLSQDFGHDIACIPRGHDPAWIISLRKPFPAPIRSWVLRQTSNEMFSRPIARCSLRGELPRRSATQALRGSPVHPCRAAASGVGTLCGYLPVPTACSRG